MKFPFFIPLTVIVFTAALALRAQDVPAPASQSGSKPHADLNAAKKPVPDKQVFQFTPDDLKKYSLIEFIIGTEMTDAGRKLPMPEFDKPVYYTMQSVEGLNVSDARGAAFIKKILTYALASNGYRPADADHPPTQALTFVCGVLNKIDSVRDAGANSAGSNGGDGSSADASRLQNLRSRAEIVGGKKFAGEFAAAFAGQLHCSGTTGCESSDSLRRFVTRDDATGSLVYEIVNDNDCYYCIVTSHDMDAPKDNGGKLLWTTRASTTARSFPLVPLEQVLPIMVNNAAYFFGRETDGVEVVRRRTSCGAPSASGTSAPAPKPAPAPTPVPQHIYGTRAGWPQSP